MKITANIDASKVEPLTKVLKELPVMFHFYEPYKGAKVLVRVYFFVYDISETELISYIEPYGECCAEKH